MGDSTSWWLRPRVVFSTLAIVVIVALLLSPSTEPGSGEPYLTTYSVAPNGARGFHDIADRLGWTVERKLEPFRELADSAVVYAVLLPPIDLTSREAGLVLDGVRAGAGLIIIPRDDSPMADSLGLRPSPWSSALSTGFEHGDSTATNPQWMPRESAPGSESWAPLYDFEVHRTLEFTRPMPPETVTFLEARKLEDSTMRAVVLGRDFGRGRVVAIADPSILLNDTMRDSGFAQLPVRLLEWVSPRPGAPLIFTEYHQGFGRHASLTRTLLRGFVETPIGRALGALAIAALLLLLSAAYRPLPPRARPRIERRSPLEHVTALARAYEQVGATRTTVRNLLRGLRRRRIVGRRSLPDTELLQALADRHPAIAPDVARVLAGTGQPVSPSELLAIGRSIATIERTIYQ